MYEIIHPYIFITSKQHGIMERCARDTPMEEGCGHQDVK
jgi:hypothetical protein